jgi:oligoribonuclease NrnB/cAMP/cGMP phosphodiesterase (DHH superfamily)
MNRALITHIADQDGAFPIILAKLIFDKIDTFSVDIKEVDETLKKIIDIYDTIYIVDLNITEEMAEYINNHDELKEKIKIFDHHKSSEYLNKYSFENVIVEENGIKECGTTLFYKYLKEEYNSLVLEKESLKTLIELVRETDTYDFKSENKISAFKLNSLYNIYGRDKYINNFYKFVKENDTFYFLETENILTEIENDRIKEYVDMKLEHVKLATINNFKVGIVFAEANRSILGNEMAKRFSDKIDIAIIIDVDRSISYRAVKEDVDVTTLASLLGGGGHKHAGGSPITEEEKVKIIEYMFKEIVWVENERI